MLDQDLKTSRLITKSNCLKTTASSKQNYVTFNLEAMLGGLALGVKIPTYTLKIFESPLKIKVILKAMLTVVL